MVVGLVIWFCLYLLHVDLRGLCARAFIPADRSLLDIARTCAPVLTSKLEISHIRAYPDVVPTEEYPLVRKPCGGDP